MISKTYILKKSIQSPAGNAIAGTRSIEEGSYYVFPYIGKLEDIANGWLGSAFYIHKDQIDKDVEWFEEYKEQKPVEVNAHVTLRLIPGRRITIFPCLCVPFFGGYHNEKKEYRWDQAEMVDCVIRGAADYFEIVSITPINKQQ